MEAIQWPQDAPEDLPLITAISTNQVTPVEEGRCWEGASGC